MLVLNDDRNKDTADNNSMEQACLEKLAEAMKYPTIEGVRMLLTTHTTGHSLSVLILS
jgi:hypothetical protein